LFEGNLAKTLLACARGETPSPPSWSAQSAVCVVAASGGYPGDHRKGAEITGLDCVRDAIVFHAGTRRENSRTLTSGGRVLAVTGLGDDLESAAEAAYRGLSNISFEGMHYRRDIGRPLFEPVGAR